MTKTSIEWADEVWNPTTGCTKVSEGCRHCYAERVAGRFWKDRKFSEVRMHPERLEEPLHWRNPRRVFVDSMTDLFHPAVPFEFIDQVFMAMASARTSHHKFLILTKRPDRMLKYIESFKNSRGWYRRESDGIAFGKWPLPNVWLGVSTEDQKAADARIPLLLQTPAAVRFISVEPMLESINIKPYLYGWHSDPRPPEKDPGIDWVICGAESGPGARPFNMDWSRSLRDQCQNAGVPFFFKQGVDNDGKLVKMPELDSKVWEEFPHA